MVWWWHFISILLDISMAMQQEPIFIGGTYHMSYFSGLKNFREYPRNSYGQTYGTKLVPPSVGSWRSPIDPVITWFINPINPTISTMNHSQVTTMRQLNATTNGGASWIPVGKSSIPISVRWCHSPNGNGLFCDLTWIGTIYFRIHHY